MDKVSHQAGFQSFCYTGIALTPVVLLCCCWMVIAVLAKTADRCNAQIHISGEIRTVPDRAYRGCSIAFCRGFFAVPAGAVVVLTAYLENYIPFIINGL